MSRAKTARDDEAVHASYMLVPRTALGDKTQKRSRLREEVAASDLR